MTNKEQDNNQNQEEPEQELEEQNTGKSTSGKLYLIGAIALVIGLALGGILFGNLTDAIGGLTAPEDGETDNGNDNGFEEAKPQIEEMLRQEKENELIMSHVEDLQESSDVEVDDEAIESGDSDSVIATVNGEEILKEQFTMLEQQQIQQMEMQGMDPDSEEMSDMLEQQRDQIIDNLVITNLLIQQADNEGISVDDEEVDEQYREFASQFGGEEAMEEQLEAEGVTAEELKSELYEQLQIQNYLDQYLDQELDEEDLEFSEDELREVYEAQQEQMQMQEELQQQMEQQEGQDPDDNNDNESNEDDQQ